MSSSSILNQFLPVFRAALPGDINKARVLYVAIAGGKVAQRSGDDSVFVALPWWSDEHVQNRFVIGQAGDVDVVVIELLPADVPADLVQLLSMYNCLMRFSADEFSVVGRASQILQWSSDHRFCGRCGSVMRLHTTHMARHCDACGNLAFPRLSPCVIVLIHDGDRVLLARGKQFPPRMFSTVAGFVEPGETLEQAVAREVFEEVGVRVGELKYFESQAWPFPHQLMVGFWARFVSGDIVIDENEISEAAWWPVHALPDIPPQQSISSQLIRQYVESRAEVRESALL